MSPPDEPALSASGHRVDRHKAVDAEGLRLLAKALIDLAIQLRAEQGLGQELKEDKIA
jgi:hypothetical protein